MLNATFSQAVEQYSLSFRLFLAICGRHHDYIINFLIKQVLSKHYTPILTKLIK
jgi:hypothetical protein